MSFDANRIACLSLVMLFLLSCSGSTTPPVLDTRPPANTDATPHRDTRDQFAPAAYPCNQVYYEALIKYDQCLAAGTCKPYCGGSGSTRGWFDGCTHQALAKPLLNTRCWETCTESIQVVCACTESRSAGWYALCA